MNKQKVWIVCDAHKEIGAAAARYLLGREQTVVTIEQILQRSFVRLNDKSQPSLDFLSVDLFQTNETEQFIQKLVSMFGGIDRLINIGDTGRLRKCVLSSMESTGHGHIIQFSDNKRIDESSVNETELTIRQSCSENKGIRYTVINPEHFSGIL